MAVATSDHFEIRGTMPAAASDPSNPTDPTDRSDWGRRPDCALVI
jgi:hypothetical protein